jgi:hypothetical protein
MMEVKKGLQLWLSFGLTRQSGAENALLSEGLNSTCKIPYKNHNPMI